MQKLASPQTIRPLILTLLCIFHNAIAQADITSGLVGWWKLTDGSGTSAVDSSGNGNTGTLENSPSWVRGKVWPFSLSLNGTNQYVLFGNPSVLNLATGSNVTMCAWIYSLSGPTGSWQGILSKRNGGAGGTPYEYGINFQTNQFQVYTSGSSGIKSFAYNPPANTWIHICGVISSSSATVLYVNGSSFGSSGSGGGVLSNTDNFVIGSSNYGEYFNGYLDDVRIYNRVLSATDVTQLYRLRSNVLHHAHFANFHVPGN